MAIQFMTKKEFIELSSGAVVAVVWNRLAIDSKLWEPSALTKEELKCDIGMWNISRWKDDKFIRVPLEFVEKKKVKYCGLDRIEVSWKWKGVGSRKALNFKKEIELLF